MRIRHRAIQVAALVLAIGAPLMFAFSQGAAQAPTPPVSGVVPAGQVNPYGLAGQLPPRIADFKAEPATIQPGQSVTLSWAAENPSGVTIDQEIGTVTARGSRRVTPSVTTTYTLTVRGAANAVLTKTVTVTVAGSRGAATPAANQAAAVKPVPRLPNGKPDFSGVYNGGGGGRGARGAGGAAAPAGPQLKPGADQYRITRGATDTGATADCMPLVSPNSFGVPYQFQIVHGKDTMVLMHEYPGTFRIIPTDGEPHDERNKDDPAWLGHSIAKWEGDVLVVDTIGYNDRTAISGFKHSESLHTVERISRTEFDVVQYEITIEDPNVWVAPFKETRTFRLMPQLKKIGEFVCENNRDYKPLFEAPK